MLVQEDCYSIRNAVHVLNVQYFSNDLVPEVSHTGIECYAENIEWPPKSVGRRTALPPAFDCALIKWINAHRAHRFPTYKDNVLASANLLIRQHVVSTEVKGGR